jgi:hypothetical protein
MNFAGNSAKGVSTGRRIFSRSMAILPPDLSHQSIKIT